jgi:hypothetical protein
MCPFVPEKPGHCVWGPMSRWQETEGRGNNILGIYWHKRGSQSQTDPCNLGYKEGHMYWLGRKWLPSGRNVDLSQDDIRVQCPWSQACPVVKLHKPHSWLCLFIAFWETMQENRVTLGQSRWLKMTVVMSLHTQKVHMLKVWSTGGGPEVWPFQRGNQVEGYYVTGAPLNGLVHVFWKGLSLTGVN